MYTFCENTEIKTEEASLLMIVDVLHIVVIQAASIRDISCEFIKAMI